MFAQMCGKYYPVLMLLLKEQLLEIHLIRFAELLTRKTAQ